MARRARVVVPGHPYHVTQRGNGRARTFFADADYALYRNLLVEYCRAANVEVWAWCLMPNHVHLILVPHDADGLHRALAPLIAALPASFTRGASAPDISGRAASAPLSWTRSIWRRRYAMCRSIRCGRDWSGARRAGRGRVRARTSPARMTGSPRGHRSASDFPNSATFTTEPKADLFDRLRAAESIGRPLGSVGFISRIERLTKRRLVPSKRGPKPKER